ncbi:hypothetical protein POG22_16440 [Geitlerinema sp. CS-897]|nr:hypothetical protein [Geitlerinema sp. CS-897]
MGKLTDSLKSTTQKLETIKNGIQNMKEIGDDLSDNTLRVAETALRAGYAYAKAEGGEVVESRVETDRDRASRPEAQFPQSESDRTLASPTVWTPETLKAKFGKLNEAYRYLKSTSGITLKTRSWATVVDAFNRLDESAREEKSLFSSLEDRLLNLEKIVAERSQYIKQLESKLEIMQARLDRLESQ